MKHQNKETSTDVSKNDPKTQKLKIWEYCDSNFLQPLSKVKCLKHSSVIASAKDNKPVIVGCKQLGEKRFKIYILENLSSKGLKRWLQLRAS